jgi:hypothetical protein
MRSYLEIIWFLIILIFANCTKEKKENVIHSAYKPVLMETARVTTDVQLFPSRENKNITLMRSLGNYLLALDYGLGIHIIDVSNINNPVKTGFYQIPACIDFEVKDNKVYANNHNHFIIVDFTDINNPVIIKREESAFDITIKSLDGLIVFDKLNAIPANTTIISYEKI